ncbi:MAG: hypothetical protein AAF629_31515 [Chloroflexota bacterium]
MAISEERLQILNMLEEGQVSADEAAKLLGALDTGVKKEQKNTSLQTNSTKGRWLRIRVDDGPGTKVNVNLPIGLVRVGLKLGSKFVPEMEGMDMAEFTNEVEAAIQEGMQGKIVEVHDEDTHVEIFIE